MPLGRLYTLRTSLTLQIRWRHLAIRVRVAPLALAVLLLIPAALPEAAETRTRILLVFDEDKDFHGLAQMNRSLRETFRAEIGGHLEFYSESLDVSKFRDRDHDGLVRDYLRRKYTGTRLDLVVAVMGPSLDFVFRHGERLFPGVPIVFCGADSADLAGRTLPANVTGVVVQRDFAPTLDIALRLQPDTRRVFVVGGTSTFDRQLQAIARADFTPFEGRVSVVYLTDLPMADLLRAVSSLPPHSVVIYLPVLADGHGRAFVPHEVAAAVAGAANAPVYVAVDQFLGLGPVGGHVYSLDGHGRHAAQVGARILRGETPASIPVAESASYANLFDWRQLQRWSLDYRRLPADSDIRFRTPRVWDLYRWHITGGVGLVIVQSALIVALLLQRAKRRRAQTALVDQLRFERLLSDLSATFVAVPAEMLDHCIRRGLARLGEDLQLDRVVLAEAAGRQDSQVAHAWNRPGVTPVPHLLTRVEFPWILSRLQAGGVVRVERLDDLPPAAATDRRNLQAAGTRSLLALPVPVDERLTRALGVATVRQERRWPADLVRRLQMVGQIYSHALTRQVSEHALRVSHGRMRNLAGRLISAQEEERRRISRELHDDLGQHVAALAIDISRLRRSPPVDRALAQKELDDLYDRTVGLIDRARRLAHDLHPAVLEHAGLAAALRTCCDELQQGRAIEVHVDLAPDLEKVPPEVALCLYRVVQEALRNVDRHAASQRVEVVVRLEAEWVELTVRDHGRGFDVGSRKRSLGLGLVSMGERVRLLGGTVDVWSDRGKGTRILARVPLGPARNGSPSLSSSDHSVGGQHPDL